MRRAIVTSLDRKARAIPSVVRPPMTRSVSAARASAESTGWQAVKMRPSSSSPRVDGAAFGGCHQPSAGIGRDAGPGPFGHSNDQGFLRQVLCKVDIAHDAGQTSDEPGPFNAENRVDRLVHLACGCAALSATAMREASRLRPTASVAAELLASGHGFP
jgi:hypothetical protein